MIQTFLRLGDVQRHTGLPCSSIYLLMSKGQFPKPVPLGPRSVGWLESEILEWQKTRIAQRDGVVAA